MKPTYNIYARKNDEFIKLFLRIHFNKSRAEIYTSVTVNDLNELTYDRYPIDSEKRRVINELIDELKYYERKLKEEDDLIHPKDIIDAYRGKQTDGKFLFELDKFIKSREQEVTRGELSKGTLKNYYTLQRHLHRFVNDHYKRDISVKRFDLKFIENYNNWMANNIEATNNGRAKLIERLKVYWKYLYRNELLLKDPFQHFKIKKVKYKREYLTDLEISHIRNFILPKALEKTRDLFLFMCNTGLAYSDAQQLSKSDLVYDGNTYLIEGYRQKSDSLFQIPLLDEARRIFEKYDGQLPRITNQAFNRNLKKMAEYTRIEKNITTHVCRHSFASIMINKGMPVEVLQRILGHSDLRMTMHYAKISRKRLIDACQQMSLKPKTNQFEKNNNTFQNNIP